MLKNGNFLVHSWFHSKCQNANQDEGVAKTWSLDRRVRRERTKWIKIRLIPILGFRGPVGPSIGSKLQQKQEKIDSYLYSQKVHSYIRLSNNVNSWYTWNKYVLISFKTFAHFPYSFRPLISAGAVSKLSRTCIMSATDLFPLKSLVKKRVYKIFVHKVQRILAVMVVSRIYGTQPNLRRDRYFPERKERPFSQKWGNFRTWKTQML